MKHLERLWFIGMVAAIVGALLLLAVGAAAGAEPAPAFVVENKCAPAFVVVNRAGAPAPDRFTATDGVTYARGPDGAYRALVARPVSAPAPAPFAAPFAAPGGGCANGQCPAPSSGRRFR